MAGTDQSVNLTGMLSGISNTIGEGYQINGMNAGKAMGNHIAEATKPKADPNDPNSYMALAEWADRNGRPEEAKAYRDEATKISALKTKQEVAEQEKAFVGDIQEIQGRMSTAMQEGNVIAYQQAQQELQAIKGSDLEQARFAESARNKAEGGLEKTQGMRTQKTANSLMEYQKRLADPNSEFQGSGRVVMEQWVEKQLDDPKIRKAYNAQVAEDAKTETMRLEALAQKEEQQAKNLHAIYKQGGLTALNEATEALGTSQAMAVQKQITEFHKLDQEWASAPDKIAADLSTLKVLEGTIEDLSETMTDDALAVFRHEHKALTDKAKSGKLTHAGELHSAVKSLKNQLNTANIARLSHVTGQKEREARAAEEAEKRVDILKVGQDQLDGVWVKWQDQIEALPQNSTGFNPFDNVKPESLPQLTLEEMYRDSVRANAGTSTKHWQIDPVTREFILDDKGMPVAVEGGQTNVPPKEPAKAATDETDKQLQDLMSAGMSRAEAEAAMKKRNLL